MPIDKDPFPGKKEFVRELRLFAETLGTKLPDVTYGHPSYRPHRGETMLALALAKWFERPAVPDKTFGISWYKDLPELLEEAFIDFRQEKEWEPLRKAYSIEMEGRDGIPDLVNIHEGGLHRLLVVMQIVHLMECLYVKIHKPFQGHFLNGSVDGSWLAKELECYFGAQSMAIEQAWKRFVRTCYRPFIKRYKNESHTGNAGKFGNTHLLTFGSAGRLMLTFRRGNVKTGDGPEVTYVADDSDEYGNRAGPNSSPTPYAECVSMIHEVVDNWDLDKLKKSSEVWFG